MGRIKRILEAIVALLIVGALCFGLGWCCRGSKKPAETPIPTKTVVVTQWRTQRIEGPRPLSERVIRKIYVPVTDTVCVHDTTYLVLPRTQKEYKDSLYHAWVSGYEPELDSLHLSIPERTVTTTLREKPKNWHLGVTAGFGAALQDKTVRLSPYVGIGVTYSLIGW